MPTKLAKYGAPSCIISHHYEMLGKLQVAPNGSDEWGTIYREYEYPKRSVSLTPNHWIVQRISIKMSQIGTAKPLNRWGRKFLRGFHRAVGHMIHMLPANITSTHY